ncbi:TlpA family protein disulfide reductase [Sphingobacterium thalpophilum]|uniref:TlpA family protein disulfide reductase n=1 Tax=Sphingobacterium thalpophilum TaxID=259 RepID=UPI0024A7862C|nr:TlpA disulfide reductase family protein [Sphingobacterium thalpophilum]
MNHLKLFVLTYIVLMTSGYLCAQHAQAIDLSKALKVGDVFVPPAAVQQMRGDGKEINLKKLEDKVVILDFFDTFCGTCIQAMPGLQKLQNKLKNKLQIITVGWQDKATLEKFFDRNEFLKENKVNLPVIYADVYLKQRFPHQSVPHVVFLFKGKVQAVTGSKLINEENVLELFRNGKIDLPLKDDFGKGNLMGSEQQGMRLKGAVSLSGYQDGVPFESLRFQKDTVTGLQKTSFYNVSIYSAVMSAWAKIKKSDYIPRAERLVLEVKDPNRYKDISNIGNIWYSQHAISYERLDSIHRTDSAQAAVVLHDLHSFLGIRSYKAMKEIPCLILKPCPVKPHTGGTPSNGMVYEGSGAMAVMTDLSGLYPPVLDMVKSKDKITLGAYDNLEELNQQLGAYGIKAEVGSGELEVLVIEEINSK